MGAMVMNMASNILGLGNAATPFGLKAMVELEKLNPEPGRATNSETLFLAINTSAITLLPPLGTIAVRSAAGSAAPDVIWMPTLIATTCSTFAAVGAHFLLRNLRVFRRRGPLAESGDEGPPVAVPDVELPRQGPRPPMGRIRALLILAFLGALGIGLGLSVPAITEASLIDANGRPFGGGRSWSLPTVFAPNITRRPREVLNSPTIPGAK